MSSSQSTREEEGCEKKGVPWHVDVQSVCTYCTVSIKIPCDHKAHSAVLSPFFDIDLPTAQVIYHFLIMIVFQINELQLHFLAFSPQGLHHHPIFDHLQYANIQKVEQEMAGNEATFHNIQF